MKQELHVKFSPGLSWQKQHSTRKLFFSNKLDLKKPVKCYIWSIGLYGAETWTLQTVELPGMFEMWLVLEMDGKFSWTDHVKTQKY